MPKWLKNQLKRAYQNKDIRQLRLLNESWFFYGGRQPENKSLHRSNKR